MRRLLLFAASVIIVVRESVAVPCPIPPPIVRKLEDGTYQRATATAHPGLCTLTRESRERWTKLPEDGGVRELVEAEQAIITEPGVSLGSPTR